MKLNEYQKQGLEQIELSLLRCEQERIDINFVLDFVVDYFATKGFKILYKKKETDKNE
jgi:hypothetical protein